MNGLVIHLAGVQCRPGVEQKFKTWYSDIHVPMLLKFQGLRAATQYEITRAIDNYPRFLAIYEFEDQKAFEAFELSPELAAALKEAEETWAEGDLKIMWLVSYNTVRTWRK